MTDVVIVGTGGLGREALWAFASDPAHQLVGFLTNDASQHGDAVCGVPVLGDVDWLAQHPDTHVVCAIGAPRARRDVVRSLAATGQPFASAIHPSVSRSDFVSLAAGCIVGANAVLTCQVRLGAHCVIGVGAVVSHDDVLEDFATLAPGVTLTGAVTVEEAAELGVGAVATPGVTIGRGALVGAGAAVVRDVPPNSVVAGVPAKELRRFEGGDRI